MNAELFQEKMDPAHRMYLCRMLNVKDLSEDLLERYAQVKRMVDRIDGHLTPGDLAMIIVNVGVTLLEKKGEDARQQALSDERAVESPTEAPTMTGEQAEAAIASGAAKPVGSLDESDDEVIEEAVEHEVEEAVEHEVEQPVSGTIGQAVGQPEKGEAKFWSPGMPVNVLQEEELKQGKIFAIHPGDGIADHDDPVQLTVSLDGGGTVTVNEDEVEAI